MPDIKPTSHQSIHSTPAGPAEASKKPSEIVKEDKPAEFRPLTKEQQDSIKQSRNTESMFAESAIKALIDPMLESPAEAHVDKQAAAKDSELTKAGADQHVASHFHKRQLADVRKGPELVGLSEGSRPAEFHVVSKETIDAIKESFTGDESPIKAEKGVASGVAKAAAEAERAAGIYPTPILDGEDEREEEGLGVNVAAEFKPAEAWMNFPTKGAEDHFIEHIVKQDKADYSKEQDSYAESELTTGGEPLLPIGTGPVVGELPGVDGKNVVKKDE